jgi:hypothetical protein
MKTSIDGMKTAINRKTTIRTASRTSVAMMTLAVVAGCSDSSNDPTTSAAPVMQTYEVTVSNLSSNQPFSPLAVVLHDQSYQGWSIGTSASSGLELLSESGDNTQFLAEASDASVLAVLSGDGIIVPGSSDRVELEINASSDVRLTLASMLVNTNDAFAGNSGLDLSSLALGDELMVRLPVYDAGTEGNNELVGTIPGPADGGEGYNSDRDDVDKVSRHSGVVSNVDGYTDSVLEQSHRFDSPIAQLVIKRLN